jgi:hypothetical protein
VKSRIQMHSTGEWYVQLRRCAFSTDSLLQDIPRACTSRTRGRCRRIVQGYGLVSQHLRIPDNHLLSGFAPKVLRLAPGGGVLLLGTSPEPESSFAPHAYPLHHSRRSIVNRLPKELGSPLRLVAGQKRRCGSKTGIEVYRNRVVGLHRVLYGLESACMTSLHLGQGNGGPDLETGWRWACVARS